MVIQRWLFEIKPGAAPAAMELLMTYPWPGNVRELQNALERAVVLCEDRKIARSIFPFLEADARDFPPEVSSAAALPYRDAMERMSASCQKQYLVEVLKRCGGNVTRAAEHAGIERESFHRLMRKCGIQADDIRRQSTEKEAAPR